MLTIGTRVWYSDTLPNGVHYRTSGTVVGVPPRSSGNYTVLSDDVWPRARRSELPAHALTVIPKRSLRLQLREFDP
jgi:hypothetical protein